MLKNYFRIAFRTLMKHKAFSFINVFGLAAAIACCMLIAAFVYDELHYDTTPEKAKQIYRVGIHVTGNGNTETYVNVDVAVGKGIKDAYPEVQDFTRVLSFGDLYLKYNDKQFKEQHLVFTDANFPTMFSLVLAEGDRKTALLQPNSIVISRSFAKKYFGNENPIGKMLTNNKFTYKVTGVMEDMPANAHFHFDGLMSMTTLPPQPQTWSNISFYTYLQLKENTDPKKLEAKFPDLVREHVAPETARDMGVSLAEALKTVNTFQFFLQPLTDIHLHSNTKYELEANGDISYVYIFSGLAIFILILACVNFTNLSTASAAKRAREVGVRKVLGSLKKQLVSQFLAESILLTLIAVVVAFIIVYLLLPSFNHLAGKQVSFGLFFGPASLSAVLLLALLAGVLAGIYPAFFLSSFNVIRALKNKTLSNTGRKSMLRSGLVVFQFAVSTSLIIATLVVYRQLHYMQNKKLGYDKEQVLFLQDTYLLGDRSVRSAFKNQLVQDSRVVSASIGTDVPGNPSVDGTQAYGKDKTHNENASEIHINIYHVDYDYIPTIGLKVIQGRNFAIRAFWYWRMDRTCGRILQRYRCTCKSADTQDGNAWFNTC